MLVKGHAMWYHYTVSIPWHKNSKHYFRRMKMQCAKPGFHFIKYKCWRQRSIVGNTSPTAKPDWDIGKIGTCFPMSSYFESTKAECSEKQKRIYAMQGQSLTQTTTVHMQTFVLWKRRHILNLWKRTLSCLLFSS